VFSRLNKWGSVHHFQKVGAPIIPKLRLWYNYHFIISVHLLLFVVKSVGLHFIHLYSVDGATESFDSRENSAYALYHTTVVRTAPANR